MTGRHTKKRLWVSLVAGFFISIQLFSVFMTVAPVKAAPGDGQLDAPAPYLEFKIRQWLMYRGMEACMPYIEADPYLPKSEVDKGDILENTDQGTFGYLAITSVLNLDGGDGNDGLVSCNNDEIFKKGTTTYLGFDSQMEFFCTFNEKMPTNAIVPDPYGESREGCLRADGFTLEYNMGKDSTIRSAFREAVKSKLGYTIPYDFEDVPGNEQAAWRYWIAKRSLEMFCGDNNAEIKADNGLPKGSDVKNDKIVPVDYVDPNTGAVTEDVAYPLDSSTDGQDDNIYNVWFWKGDTDDGNGEDETCNSLVNRLQGSSGQASKWINEFLTNKAGNDLKAGMDTATIDAWCKTAKKTGCVAQVNSAIDACKTDGTVVSQATDKDIMARIPILKECIQKKLPPGLYEASNIANITGDPLKDPNIKAEEEEATCEGGNGPLGWITCKILDALDNMMNALDGHINNLLFINQDYYSDAKLGDAWRAMRNLAYIILIPLMMVMVIGTAIGSSLLDAYTVKKALPRMVAAVIFIALSLPICQLGVRISNSVGNGIGNFLVQSLPEAQQITSIASIVDGGDGGTKAGLGVLAVAGVGLANAFTLGGFAFVIIVGLLVGFIVLVMRQVLLITMIVVAPIAILAWIFPGNDKIWNIWKSTFIAMLTMYPIVALLIASGKFVAGVVGGGGI